MIDKGKSFIVQDVNSSYVDFDISATLRLTSSINTGFNIMNIRGTELMASEGKLKKTRALAFGLTYEKNRLQLGFDVKLAEDEKNDFAFGLNYIPFNNAKINLGSSSAFETFVVGAEYFVLNYSFNRSQIFGSSHFAGLNFRF